MDRAIDFGHPDGHRDPARAVEVALVRPRLDGGQERVLHAERDLVAVGDHAAGADVDLGGELEKSESRRAVREHVLKRR